MVHGVRLKVWFGVAALWGVIVPSVHAQTLGGVRLRVDPAFFEYSQQTTESPDLDLGVESSTVAFGFFPSGMALGIGGSPSNNFNVGVNVLLAIASTTSELVGDDAPSDAAPTETDQTNISLLGYGEYIFNGEATRGFVGLNLGVGTATATNDDGESASGTVGVIGASAGAHYFLNQYVSLDPQIRFLYNAGKVESIDVSGFSVAFVLGLSAWLGNTASTADDSTGSGSGAASEGDAWATRRPAPSRPAAPLTTGNATTVRAAIDIGTTRIHVMGTADHPDVIVLRFVRMTPAHRAPTIRCDSWFAVSADTRTEVPGAVYKGAPSGPGIEESLKSHVPLSVLQTLAPANAGYGPVAGAFDVCGETIALTISSRTHLVTFLQRFEKMLERNGVTHAASPETPQTAPASDGATDGATAPEVPAAPTL